MLSAYQQLKALCLQLHRGGNKRHLSNNYNKSLENTECDFVHSHHLPLGYLNDIVLELKSLGMISHKKSLITIFGHKHKIKNFIKKFDIFHKKN